jgi:topoisomerase-4 subunit A
MAGLTVLQAEQGVTVVSGKRVLKIKPADLVNYQGERGRRGQKLPRGFQRVDALIAGIS